MTKIAKFLVSAVLGTLTLGNSNNLYLTAYTADYGP